MIRLLWAASVRTRCYLRRYMPTNIAVDAIRTRRGLKWGVPAMLLAAPYVLAASICTNLIAGGAPGWLNLLVLLFIWNAIKFIIMGPISLVLLIRARLQETVAQRRACADQATRDELTVADEPMSGVPR
ncbi:sulfate permease [Microbacterium protaetiae]|uniref:Sulfate permease n=1 Tax=Microbacterium protaetiae TaxID=2509458 RepID=A0A4P6E9E8_9MICO|nr:sulfate permease [Microbacterium protaetiae]QAY58675.1 sulfate permease [Microbacterium protaetiae]